MGDDVKFIITHRFGTEALTKGSDGLWRSVDGTVYALRDGKTADPVNRCGVAPFALPTWDFFQPLNDACSPHDYAYTSPAYQMFHTREEADEYLEHLITLSGHPILGGIFEDLARQLGVPYWENPATNN